LENRGIVIGGGAFARETLDWAKRSLNAENNYNFCCYLDAEPNALSGFENLALTNLGDPLTYDPQPGDLFLMAIGDPINKDVIATRLEGMGAKFVTVIHNSAVVSDSASIGNGVVIGPHAYVATNATLGAFACINSLTGIGHDAHVGRSCTISSQVDITGRVIIEERVFIGSGARILPSIKIGSEAKVGAGSIVVRGIKSKATVFAQPARKI
jgi:sugar O-acyltransferase (sialic acid O-acetyltransferase NeuD family)